MTTTDAPMSYAALKRWLLEHGGQLIAEAGCDDLALKVMDALAEHQKRNVAETEAALRGAVSKYREAREK